MRRALALAALLVLTPPAVAAQDAQKQLADLLVELLDRRTQPTTAETMQKLQDEIGAVVGRLTARDPADFYNRKLDDLAIAALRAHRPERAADWEVDARRPYISQTRAVLRALRQALEMRNLDEGALPTTEQGLASLAVKGGRGGPYLDPALPLTDAWGRPFVYRHPGKDKPYDLFSLGPDEKEGTADDIE
jgi:type II secretion system protein G